MAGAILFTILFGASATLPFFTFAWTGNRLVQSTGWAGMVKITSRWFSYSSYGRVMGVISLSYLFGDAASRELMSLLIGAGLGWRGVFYAAAGILGALLLINLLFLRETPEQISLREPPANPANLLGEQGKKSKPVAHGFRPEPHLLARLSSFLRNYDSEGDLQSVDANLLHPSPGIDGG
jgi:OPA family glycerol-3-phosphate transporter-like MFS transporter